MNLYLFENPEWDYDEHMAMVVRHETPEKARALAVRTVGGRAAVRRTWQDTETVRCTLIGTALPHLKRPAVIVESILYG